jgi:hypothetical protein
VSRAKVSVAIIATVPYSIAVSKLHRPFLSHRYFFIVERLLWRREKFTEPDFPLLARAFNRARALHPFYLTVLPKSERRYEMKSRTGMHRPADTYALPADSSSQ